MSEMVQIGRMSDFSLHSGIPSCTVADLLDRKRGKKETPTPPRKVNLGKKEGGKDGRPYQWTCSDEMPKKVD